VLGWAAEGRGWVPGEGGADGGGRAVGEWGERGELGGL
jgi:hypothetical protein